MVKEDSQGSFRKITEQPGQRASREQLVRLFHRYHFARPFADGRTVLEVGCGSGLGLGYLAEVAQSVIGGDIDQENIDEATEHYSDRSSIQVALLDAHELPLEDGEVDAVVCLETIYYLKSPEVFAKEASRVLSGGGVLVISTVNSDWRDFHPSIYSHMYFSVPELNDLLKSAFTDIRFFGAFRTQTTGVREKLRSFLKRAAIKANLMPGSYRVRVVLKRAFLGRLKPIPDEVYEGMTAYEDPVELPPEESTGEFKMFYAVARK